MAEPVPRLPATMANMDMSNGRMRSACMHERPEDEHDEVI